jgi:hypothetical protein
VTDSDVTHLAGGPELSVLLIALLKGVVHQEPQTALWQSLLRLQARVRDYVGVLGLELILDEAEGYAYLRQRAASDGEPELPRLVARRPLGYAVSLMLALLRKRLAEFDARGTDSRLVLDRDEVVEMVRVFFADTGNEAQLVDRIDTHLNRIVELGFLRRLRGGGERFEVQRVLKAFVDAQWLHELDQRLAAYRAHATAAGDGEPGSRP